MSETKRWSIEISIDEDDRETYAEAKLRTQDDACLRGHGRARRNPVDPNVPQIGDELAVARALADLAQKLLHAAAEDIEAVTHQPAHLRA